jgi:hypothetical protein
MVFSRRAAETKKEVWDTARQIKVRITETTHSAIKLTTVNQNGTTPATTSSSRKMKSKASQRPLAQGTARTNRVSANPHITVVQIQVTAVNQVGRTIKQPRQFP